jgi:hypothetical protein
VTRSLAAGVVSMVASTSITMTCGAGGRRRQHSHRQARQASAAGRAPRPVTAAYVRELRAHGEPAQRGSRAAAQLVAAAGPLGSSGS